MYIHMNMNLILIYLYIVLRRLSRLFLTLKISTIVAWIQNALNSAKFQFCCIVSAFQAWIQYQNKRNNRCNTRHLIHAIASIWQCLPNVCTLIQSIKGKQILIAMKTKWFNLFIHHALTLVCQFAFDSFFYHAPYSIRSNVSSLNVYICLSLFFLYSKFLKFLYV